MIERPDGLPQPVVEPLAPPPGHFDAVLSRAVRRRHQRTARFLVVVVVFLAGAGGGMSLDGGVAGVPQALVDLATDGAPPPPSAAPLDTSTSATVTPEASSAPVTTEPTEPSPDVKPTPQGVLGFRGRAVSTEGAGLSGLYVYTGVPGHASFVPTDRPAGVTDAHGEFSLPCPGTPVLLAPWPVNAPAGQLAATATWAATFVGGATQPSSAADAPCSRTKKVTDVVVQRGASIAGTATVPAACDTGRTLRVALYDDPATTVRVTGVRDGDEVTVAGLPPGEHTVVAAGVGSTVTVGGTSVTAYDATFACAVPLPSETPTPTTTPTPQPSETSSPTPTATLTTEPEPTPGNTSSPSATPAPAPAR